MDFDDWLKKDDVLAHYTSIDNALKILESGFINFSPISYASDALDPTERAFSGINFGEKSESGESVRFLKTSRNNSKAA